MSKVCMLEGTLNDSSSLFPKSKNFNDCGIRRSSMVSNPFPYKSNHSKPCGNLMVASSITPNEAMLKFNFFNFESGGKLMPEISKGSPERSISSKEAGKVKFVNLPLAEMYIVNVLRAGGKSFKVDRSISLSPTSRSLTVFETSGNASNRFSFKFNDINLGVLIRIASSSLPLKFISVQSGRSHLNSVKSLSVIDNLTRVLGKLVVS
ncbi:hypothetical protein PGUG_04606 [Meyerozyma guilliermondii ATCC 6260]|uniref:Uncharacterized protein n=1 Tax=Meyerozyma guilliermondii (strain ATCC 6260 / CBS 566 / DSM 6381 / JCM 1539 / NBRC 10279 / NRRL Y-324) TaxID=294746 RepID=A5DMV5_PICGU|nr:uncharacterized protein PGUG_04606 [Meyerozyma guilliermondii ATCC 6260]EDK40508.2 hypothetical protein PGUG_04606 [Meyerozyma guilliermondii ATCC 6260]